MYRNMQIGVYKQSWYVHITLISLDSLDVFDCYQESISLKLFKNSVSYWILSLGCCWFDQRITSLYGSNSATKGAALARQWLVQTGCSIQTWGNSFIIDYSNASKIIWGKITKISFYSAPLLFTSTVSNYS